MPSFYTMFCYVTLGVAFGTLRNYCKYHASGLWGVIRGPLGHSWCILGLPGLSLEPLWGLSGLPGDSFGTTGVHLGVPRAVLGTSLGCLGTPRGLFWDTRGASWGWVSRDSPGTLWVPLGTCLVPLKALGWYGSGLPLVSKGVLQRYSEIHGYEVSSRNTAGELGMGDGLSNRRADPIPPKGGAH